MPPYSTKRKKEQLQKKRQQKRERDDDPKSFYRNIVQKTTFSGKAMGKSNTLQKEQPKHGDPNTRRERFADLQFFKDDDEEIKQRKEQAMLPITCLSSIDREIRADCEAGSLDMPRRPPWNKDLTKEQLDRQEQTYFKNFIDKLLMDAKDSDKKLSYFDLNLETWRQLWRVIEMSEIVTIIVDIRHPLFHLPPSLYRYIVDELNKMVIIVLNKVDLVPAQLVTAWQDYLKSQYPEVRIIPFASYAGMKSKPNGRRVGMLHMAIEGAQRFLNQVEEMVAADKIDFTSWREKIDNELSSSLKRESCKKTEMNLEKLKIQESDSDDLKYREASSSRNGTPDEVENQCDDFSDDNTRANRKKSKRKGQKNKFKAQTSKANPTKTIQTEASSQKLSIKSDDSETDCDGEDYDEEESEDDDGYAEKALRNATQLIQENDTSHYREEKYLHGILTIGCVGQPNVGKSSFMNALIGKKLVSVSRTPGHTKHFQTIFLTPNVRLCDCPGLVFPSYYPKPLQVLMGCYPISQLREPYSSITYLAERLDVPRILNLRVLDDMGKLSNFNSIKKDQPVDWTGWSAFTICESWAVFKGFLTARSGRPDVYRAANHLLRMALDGRTLCLSFFTPGYNRLNEN